MYAGSAYEYTHTELPLTSPLTSLFTIDIRNSSLHTGKGITPNTMYNVSDQITYT
jgi:hypothetical protein